MPDAIQRPWDARLARLLVTPLKDSRVTPNHLTSVRLAVGLAAVAAFTAGTFGWSNVGALLLILSNFLDHTDGELARISGRGSRFGHYYDLASDALITILLFVAIGVGIGGHSDEWDWQPVLLGALAGCSIAVIFFLRMRIEALLGKVAVRQGSLAGFETEDVLYLFPLLSLSNCLTQTLHAAALCAPFFAVWVVIDYRRLMRRRERAPAAHNSGLADSK